MSARAGSGFTTDAHGLPADPAGPLLTAWVPLAPTDGAGLFQAAPGSHLDMQTSFWGTAPWFGARGGQGFDPYAEGAVAQRYPLEVAGVGMAVGDVLFTEGWLLRTPIGRAPTPALGLSVVGGDVRGLPAPVLGRQYTPPERDGTPSLGLGEEPHAGWAGAVGQLAPGQPVPPQLMPVLWSPEAP